MYRRYVIYSVALVSAALILSGLLDLYLAFQENTSLVVPLQRTGLLLLAGLVLYPIVRLGWTRPRRSYLRSVCGCIPSIRAATLMKMRS